MNPMSNLDVENDVYVPNVDVIFTTKILTVTPKSTF